MSPLPNKKEIEMKKMIAFTAIAAASFISTGCASLNQMTNMLTDSDIVTATGKVLGYAPQDLGIVSKTPVDSYNTHVELLAKDGKEFSCNIISSYATHGIAEAPKCASK